MFAYANVLNYILKLSRWHTLPIYLLQSALWFFKYPLKQHMRSIQKKLTSLPTTFAQVIWGHFSLYLQCKCIINCCTVLGKSSNWAEAFWWSSSYSEFVFFFNLNILGLGREQQNLISFDFKHDSPTRKELLRFRITFKFKRDALVQGQVIMLDSISLHIRNENKILASTAVTIWRSVGYSARNQSSFHFLPLKPANW